MSSTSEQAAGPVRVLARLRRAARRDRPGARSLTRLWLSLSLAAALVPSYKVVRTRRFLSWRVRARRGREGFAFPERVRWGH